MPRSKLCRLNFRGFLESRLRSSQEVICGAGSFTVACVADGGAAKMSERNGKEKIEKVFRLLAPPLVSVAPPPSYSSSAHKTASYAGYFTEELKK